MYNIIITNDSNDVIINDDDDDDEWRSGRSGPCLKQNFPDPGYFGHVRNYYARDVLF